MKTKRTALIALVLVLVLAFSVIGMAAKKVSEDSYTGMWLTEKYSNGNIGEMMIYPCHVVELATIKADNSVDVYGTYEWKIDNDTLVIFGTSGDGDSYNAMYSLLNDGKSLMRISVDPDLQRVYYKN